MFRYEKKNKKFIKEIIARQNYVSQDEGGKVLHDSTDGSDHRPIITIICWLKSDY